MKKTASERISIERYNKEIDEAEAEYEKGDYITHEELRKEMKEWNRTDEMSHRDI